jgi:tetratricopeptide (TPR) repeat protein
MIFKAIFTGHFDFGTERSYEQVLKMYRRRVENYYKADILLVEEEVFIEDELSLVIGKQTMNCSKRFWRNTYLLIDYVAQYAVSGNMKVWLVDPETKKILKDIEIEPTGDRSTVVFYKKGIELMKAGNKEAAIEAFTNSISKYAKHSNSYEKRGLLHQQLGNLKEAKSDFLKAIEIYAGSQDAHLGLGEIAFAEDNYELANKHFTLSIKHSIPHQSSFWSARYKKGDTHYLLGELEAAAQEYKFFCYRDFTEDNPNFKLKRLAHLKWGKTLMEIKDKEQDALKAFDAMLKIKDVEHDGLTDGEMRLWRGKARYQVGKKGFKEDWVFAKKAGLAEAKKLLESYKR